MADLIDLSNKPHNNPIVPKLPCNPKTAPSHPLRLSRAVYKRNKKNKTHKTLPLRSCVICRAKKEKVLLLRLSIIYPDIDPINALLEKDRKNERTKPLPQVIETDILHHTGRGVWVCRTSNCTQNLTKKNALSKAFRKKVTIDPVLVQKLNGDAKKLL
jgi:predicted RNA-binding protein YlxR (DUF448 family)